MIFSRKLNQSYPEVQLWCRSAPRCCLFLGTKILQAKILFVLIMNGEEQGGKQGETQTMPYSLLIACLSSAAQFPISLPHHSEIVPQEDLISR